MTKIYCDKCSKESTDRIIVDLPYEKHDVSIWMKSYDLCPDCFDKLKKWMDEDDKENI